MEFLTQIKRWENRILKRRLKRIPPWVLRIQTTLWKHRYLKVFYSFYVLSVYWIEEKEKRRNEQLKNHYLKRRDWCSTLQYPEWMISVPEDLFDTSSTESGWYSLLLCFSTVFVGMSPADCNRCYWRQKARPDGTSIRPSAPDSSASDRSLRTAQDILDKD